MFIYILIACVLVLLCGFHVDLFFSNHLCVCGILSLSLSLSLSVCVCVCVCVCTCVWWGSYITWGMNGSLLVQVPVI